MPTKNSKYGHRHKWAKGPIGTNTRVCVDCGQRQKKEKGQWVKVK